MGVTITPAGPFKAGTKPELTAQAGGPAASWEWAAADSGSTSFQPIPGADKNTFEVDVDQYAGKTLRATAQLKAGGSDSGELKVEKAPATEAGDGNGGDPPAEPPSVWHGGFALGAGIAAVVLLAAFIIVTSIEEAKLGLDPTAYAKLDGRGLVGAAVIGPIALLGVTVTLIGVWMVAVEWRGRFAKEPQAEVQAQSKGMPADIGTVVTALGKLKGATLVLLSGVAILMATAWMTSSTTGAEPSPSTTGGTTTTSAEAPPATSQ